MLVEVSTATFCFENDARVRVLANISASDILTADILSNVHGHALRINTAWASAGI